MGDAGRVCGDLLRSHLLGDVNLVCTTDFITDFSSQLWVEAFRDGSDAEASLSRKNGLLAGAFYDFIKLDTLHSGIGLFLFQKRIFKLVKNPNEWVEHSVWLDALDMVIVARVLA